MAGNLVLPQKVRYKPGKKQKAVDKPVPPCRDERTYKDFLRYMEEHPEAGIVEMDADEGIKRACTPDNALSQLQFHARLFVRAQYAGMCISGIQRFGGLPWH